MVKKRTKKPTSTVNQSITILWVLAAIPVLSFIIYQISSIGPLIVMAAIISGVILTYKVPVPTRIDSRLFGIGVILSAINLVCVLDMFHEVFLVPLFGNPLCGSSSYGLGLGNCFLADGFGVFSYLILSIPILTVIANILFTIHIKNKAR